MGKGSGGHNHGKGGQTRNQWIRYKKKVERYAAHGCASYPKRRQRPYSKEKKDIR